ncbi:hypothetical protein B0H11DRAFT_2267714 [Mycena galericulata]|nr:hypothetical protein B0H11DRAFT_2267714 [Mycena galericulata]
MPLSVAQLEANAKDLRRFCETTPGKNALQPIAASAVEICSAAANLVGNGSDGSGAKLAAYVVGQTESLIKKIAMGPLSLEICEALEIHEEKLDAIRRHFENMPVLVRKNATKFILSLRFKRETRRLKADLKSHMRGIVAICDDKSAEAKKGALRSEDILEVVSLSFRVVGAISDIHPLNVMKPVVGIATLICDTAKCVKSNREAALALAARASTMTRSIVDRAAMDGAAVPDPEALNALKLALKDIQSYLTVLKKPRRRFSSWILANQVKDRFVKLDGELDKAVALFSPTQALRTSGDVQGNARDGSARDYGPALGYHVDHLPLLFDATVAVRAATIKRISAPLSHSH